MKIRITKPQTVTVETHRRNFVPDVSHDPQVITDGELLDCASIKRGQKAKGGRTNRVYLTVPRTEQDELRPVILRAFSIPESDYEVIEE